MPVLIQSWHCSLSQVIRRTQRWLQSGLDPIEKFIFINNSPTITPSRFLPVYQALRDTDWPPVPFFNTYKEHISPEKNAKFGVCDSKTAWDIEFFLRSPGLHCRDGEVLHARDIMVIFALSYEDFIDYTNQSLWPTYSHNVWWNSERHGPQCTCERTRFGYCSSAHGWKRISKLRAQFNGWRYNEGTTDVFEYSKPAPCCSEDVRVESAHVHLQVAMGEIMEHLWFGPGNRVLSMLKRAAEITGESELELMSREPTEADDLVKIPTGTIAQRLMEQCGFEGTMERVAIL
ncbi:hypothetical protein QBC44DRAFT_731 [Cladorrhinum sp. PSN332]|nr:hypothetical protein QBC44DRAFT_731 [Cladorrhinum sp. PSN332]